ncbi:MAG: vWA domain-containing protein [Capsulimonadaceae bacterium]
MNLTNPANLFWLIPLVGGILVLWMLRLKRVEQTVPSLYLWRSLLRENQANTPFQRLRRHLLLLLQILAACLLIFALAKPFVYARALSGRTFVIIIDASASMNATDVRPSRLEEAKSQAAHFVDQEMGDNDVATVIAASSRPEAQMAFTGNKLRIKDAIHDIAPTDTIADIPAALTLAQSDIGGAAGATIRLYSDGAFGTDMTRRVADFPFGTTGFQLVPIGTSHADNVAITAMDGRRDPDTGYYQVFVEVREFGSGRHDGATVSLYKDDRLIDARPLDLQGGRQSETFSGPLLGTGGTVTAKLDGISDDLAADDQASLVLPPPRPRSVLLVSPGNLFLENGLTLNSDVHVAEVAPDDFATIGKNGKGYAMVVFDGWLPDQPLSPGNYLVINVENAQTPLVPSAEMADNPALVDQNQTDPVMRFVDLSGLNIAQSPVTHAAPWGQSLADADTGTLIAVGEHEGSRMIDVAFALSDSDWPLRVSFPIFLTNAVDWLTAGGGLGPASPDTPAGAAASLTVPAGLSSLAVSTPDGRSLTMATPADGGAAVFDETERVGLYRVHGAGYDTPVAVNLLSADESDLTPEPHTDLDRIGAPPVARPHTPTRTKNDVWPQVASVALLFLTVEWLVFHRRPGV